MDILQMILGYLTNMRHFWGYLTDRRHFGVFLPLSAQVYLGDFCLLDAERSKIIDNQNKRLENNITLNEDEVLLFQLLEQSEILLLGITIFSRFQSVLIISGRRGADGDTFNTLLFVAPQLERHKGNPDGVPRTPFHDLR